MPATLTLKRGDTWATTLRYRQGDASGDPVDLTGCALDLHVRDRAGARRLSLSLGAGLTLADPASGDIALRVEAAASAALPVGALVWDLQVTHPDGTVRSTETGRLIVVPDITYPDAAP